MMFHPELEVSLYLSNFSEPTNRLRHIQEIKNYLEKVYKHPRNSERMMFHPELELSLYLPTNRLRDIQENKN